MAGHERAQLLVVAIQVLTLSPCKQFHYPSGAFSLCLQFLSSTCRFWYVEFRIYGCFIFHLLLTCSIVANIGFLLPAQVKGECYAAKFNQVFAFLTTFMLNLYMYTVMDRYLSIPTTVGEN